MAGIVLHCSVHLKAVYRMIQISHTQEVYL